VNTFTHYVNVYVYFNPERQDVQLTRTDLSPLIAQNQPYQPTEAPLTAVLDDSLFEAVSSLPSSPPYLGFHFGLGGNVCRIWLKKQVVVKEM
jgi:hypothetical protein